MPNELFTDDVMTLRVIEDITGLEDYSTKVTIKFTDGTKIVQYHDQDCCESVLVAQVDGNVEKHIGATMLSIEEKITRPSEEITNEDGWDYTPDSLTATFYTLKTSKGYLDWRWDGESNGCYSESVDCEFIRPGGTNDNT